MLGDVNKLLKTKQKILSMPSTDNDGDEIESRISFQIYSTLQSHNVLRFGVVYKYATSEFLATMYYDLVFCQVYSVPI